MDQKQVVIIILVCILIGILGVVIYFALEFVRGKDAVANREQMNQRNEGDEGDKKKNLQNISYIEPAEFKVGIMEQKQPVSSSICNSLLLYQVPQPNVDYGSKFPDNCPYLQFVESP